MDQKLLMDLKENYQPAADEQINYEEFVEIMMSK